MMRKAQSTAFFRIYAFGDFMSFSISPARSRAISGDAIAPSVQSARPTTNCVGLLRSLKDKDVKLTLKNSSLHSLFQTICDQEMNVLSLVEQQHRAKISDPFVGELRAGYQLEALELAEVRRIAEHVNVEELCDVPASPDGVLFAER